MSHFKVGDRVQWVDRDTDEVTGGIIESTVPPKRMKVNDWWSTNKYSEAEREEMITYANVKWDDNTTDAVDIDDLDREDSQLEREFRTEANAHLNEIFVKANAASDLLAEAVALSEKYGIPFQSPVSFLGQSYFPNTFKQKYKGVDTSFVYSVTYASSEYGYGGWEHSDVC
jgi:hypothetical protein